MDKLDIQLMGRQYSVSVKTEEQETLLAAVVLVDERLKKLAGKSASGGEALALMTALDIANEYVTHQRAGGLDLPDYKRRINSMDEQFEAALAKQEKLF